MIHEDVLRRAESLAAEFASATPFRHVVIDDFLGAADYAELVASFPPFDAAQARNELGQTGRKAVVPNLTSLGPAYARFDELMRSTQFLAFVSRVTAIRDLLYDPEYVGGGTHENLDGQDLDLHVDFNYHPGRQWHRRLNLILFLNEEWEEGWGGLLELQGDPWREAEARKVMPSANRCVIFETTECSWHGFRRIRLPEEKRHLSRRSIAVYFYTKERPREERAPSHGTVYVPRPLPEHLEAGHTLSDDDVFELNLAVARRDEQIRYLYERELEYSRIAGSASFRLARALTRPGRWLRDLVRGNGTRRGERG
jgi:Rps23 Pro-64 3,4-dihydroxylase Tpa1-like proline 4-hydroxylase